MAERVGFEPTIRLRVFRFSIPARSTAPSPLRLPAFYQRAGSARRTDRLQGAHVGQQRARDVDSAVAALIVLHHRDERSPDREAGSVQRVHELWLALLVAESRLHPSRLERLEVAARRDLAIRALTGKPNLDVVRLCRGEAGVS